VRGIPYGREHYTDRGEEGERVKGVCSFSDCTEECVCWSKGINAQKAVEGSTLKGTGRPKDTH